MRYHCYCRSLSVGTKTGYRLFSVTAVDKLDCIHEGGKRFCSEHMHGCQTQCCNSRAQFSDPDFHYERESLWSVSAQACSLFVSGLAVPLTTVRPLFFATNRRTFTVNNVSY